MVQKAKEYLKQNGVMATNKCKDSTFFFFFYNTELDLLMVNIFIEKNEKESTSEAGNKKLILDQLITWQKNRFLHVCQLGNKFSKLN